MQPSAVALSATQRHWTVLSLLQWAAQYLADHGFDEARLHVELLLARVLSCSRLELYTSFDRPLTQEELAGFKALLKRRLTHEPLQYILGETEFMGIRLAVDRRVLIPRPETESLVEKALEAMKTMPGRSIDVLDIGTGSGNIAIAVAKLEPRARVAAIDVSADALHVAESNARHNDAGTVEFFRASVFDEFLPDRELDVIISNPPYISREEFPHVQPEVKDFEPRIATTDDADGLTFVRRIAEVSSQRLRHGGWLFLEIAYNQSAQVKEILERADLCDVRVAEDFAGHPRIVSARK